MKNKPLVAIFLWLVFVSQRESLITVSLFYSNLKKLKNSLNNTIKIWSPVCVSPNYSYFFSSMFFILLILILNCIYKHIANYIHKKKLVITFLLKIFKWKTNLLWQFSSYLVLFHVGNHLLLLLFLILI